MAVELLPEGLWGLVQPEPIACGVPPLDILIRDLERKASTRFRNDQFPICSWSPYNVRT
jgi:hypothetical protein